MGRGRWWRWWGLILVVAVAVVESTASQSKQDHLVSRIAFGSCSDQSDPQHIWNAINNFDPQVFIWLGDNIYGDIKHPFKLFGKERTLGPWKNIPRFTPSSKQEMEAKYKKAKTNPGYSRLRENTKVIGTWDDHDYGLNDAGKEFSEKITNQGLLLDFLDEPLDSPRRKQEGVYASYTFGPVSRQIKVILLDTRYHRDPLLSDGTFLGKSQWAWLEKELNGPASAITIIGSSVQVISNHSGATGPLFFFECWGRFPKERDRLFKLIADSKRDGVFFISGDVHFGEIARYDCATGYPLYDITSSGLTKAVEKAYNNQLLQIPQSHIILTSKSIYKTRARPRSYNLKMPFGTVVEVEPPSPLRYIIGAAIMMIGVVLPVGYMMFRTKRVPSSSSYSKQTNKVLI